MLTHTGIGCSPQVLTQKGRVAGWRSCLGITGDDRVIIEVEEEFQINYYVVHSGIIVYHGHGNIQQGINDILRMVYFVRAVELAALGQWLECKKFCEEYYILIVREIVLDNHLENVLGEWVD